MGIGFRSPPFNLDFQKIQIGGKSKWHTTTDGKKEISLFAAAPPVVNPDAAAVTLVWSYVGELIFNMLILVGAVKMADRVVREMMGL